MVKDIIDWVVTHGIRYLRSMGGLVCRPKTFLAEAVRDSDQGLGEAMTFVGLSAALVVLPTAPLLCREMDLWEYLVVRLLQLGLGVALLAVCLKATWWLVGGRAPLAYFFEICAYLGGVAILIVVFFELLGEGILRLGDSNLYDALRQVEDRDELSLLFDSPVGLAYLGTLLMSLVAVLVWIVAGWGSFREITNMSRRRSIVAFLLSMPVALLVLSVVFAVAVPFIPLD